MTTASPPSPHDRILHAALELLERGGPSAVSTRSVSSAAGVQVPTLYRQFGDMQGLLGAVAYLGFTAYLERKQGQTPQPDPVEDLRQGWDRHVEFGLAHPHLYRLMNSVPLSDASSAAEREMNGLLKATLSRVAAAGRLALHVDRAASLLHAACTGLTLDLIAAGADADLTLPALMRETVLRTLLIPNPDRPPAEVSPRQRAASHAVALETLLPELGAPLSDAEEALLTEWLHRLSCTD